MTESESTPGEKRILAVLEDIKGQLNGMGNRQIETARSIADLVNHLQILVSEWQTYRKEVELAQAKREVEAIAAHYSKPPKKAPRRRRNAAGSPPKKTRKKAGR